MPESFEERITAIAQAYPYPEMSHQREQGVSIQPIMRRVATVLFVLIMAGLAIPEIRAGVFEILQIGTITITLDGTSETGEPLRLSDIAGETTLADAQANVRFDIRIPPNDPPDKVFLQDQEVVILVWLDGTQIERVLYQVAHDLWGVYKTLDEAIVTSVNDEHAVWGYQDHFVTITDGETVFTHFVTDNVLVWTDRVTTYRLEADISMEEAVALAESLVVFDDDPSVNPSP